MSVWGRKKLLQGTRGCHQASERPPHSLAFRHTQRGQTESRRVHSSGRCLVGTTLQTRCWAFRMRWGREPNIPALLDFPVWWTMRTTNKGTVTTNYDKGFERDPKGSGKNVFGDDLFEVVPFLLRVPAQGRRGVGTQSPGGSGPDGETAPAGPRGEGAPG